MRMVFLKGIGRRGVYYHFLGRRFSERKGQIGFTFLLVDKIRTYRREITVNSVIWPWPYLPESDWFLGAGDQFSIHSCVCLP